MMRSVIGRDRRSYDSVIPGSPQLPAQMLLWLTALLLTLICSATVLPATTLAASLELGPATLQRLDKALADADRLHSTSIRKLYVQLESLQQQDTELEAMTKTEKLRNDGALLALRERMKSLDKSRLEQLTRQAESARKLYQPLFTAYSSLNSQVQAARKSGNKARAESLSAQASELKLAVQLARQDLKLRKDTLQAAKQQRARTLQAVRHVLAELDRVKLKAKQQRLEMSTTRKSLTTTWKSFNQHMKNKDAPRMSTSLTSLTRLAHTIVQARQQLYDLEQQRGRILTRATSILSK